MARILIVDDDESIRLILQTYLSKDGHTIETAADGMDALEKIRIFNPGLILLDINMPKMSGFEVIKRLKENPETSGIPIFVMTALSQEVNIKKGYQLGIDEYITKPSNIEHLKLRINKYFKRGSAASVHATGIPKASDIERIKSSVNDYLKASRDPSATYKRITTGVEVELIKKKMNDPHKDK